MRVTPSMTADNALYHLQKGRSILARLEEQIASGAQINRPSDDPITARELLELQSKLDKGSQYLGNITKGNVWLNMTDTALKGMADIVSQMKALVGTITSGSSDQTVRDNAAFQLTELKKQLIDLGNTQLGDQYIFAGFRNSTPPFSRSSNNYGGTGDDISVAITQTSQTAINVTGDKLLKGTGSYGSVDILATVDSVVTAINNNDPAAIQAGAARLDAAANQITNARSDVASKMLRMQSAEQMLTQNQNTVQGIFDDTQSVDYIKAATELNQQQTAFEAALSATAKITQLSLLDYLR